MQIKSLYREQINKKRIQLNNENRYIFENINSYIASSSLEKFEKDEILIQLIDIFVQLQDKNRNICEFIGEDTQAYCDSLIEPYKKGKINIINNIIYNIKYISFIMLALVTLNYLYVKFQSKGFFDIKWPITISILTMFFLIIILVPVYFYLLQRINFQKWDTKLILEGFFFCISAILVMGAFFIDVNYCNSSIIYNINIYVPIWSMAFIYFVSEFYENIPYVLKTVKTSGNKIINILNMILPVILFMCIITVSNFILVCLILIAAIIVQYYYNNCI